jgi:hypothetical protein
VSDLSTYVAAVRQHKRDAFMRLYPYPFMLVKLEDAKQVPSAAPESDWNTSTQVTVNMAKTGSFAVLRHNAALYRVYPVRAREAGIEPEQVSVGRQASNDIVLTEQSVSKAHAQFVLEPGVDATLIDLGSRNGTTVRGRRLAPHKPEPLEFGDPIVLGGVACTLIGAGALWEIIYAQIRTDT